MRHRKVPNAFEQLVHILTADLPEDKETIMTFAHQLKQQGREEGREEGIHLNAISIAKKLIAQGRSIQYIQDLTNLSEKEVIGLVELEKV